ncbi:MAG: hypothetical protein ACD_20C00094G0011 [uncultured bacterium]|nr:MAG: hypothetical protein ACD_20C00094G0011 [uncultured bacterium]
MNFSGITGQQAFGNTPYMPAYRPDSTSVFGSPNSSIFNMGNIATANLIGSNPMLDNTFNMIDQFIGSVNAGMYPNQKQAATGAQAPQQGLQAPQQGLQIPGMMPQAPQQGLQTPGLAPQVAPGGFDITSLMGMLQQMLMYLTNAPANNQAAPNNQLPTNNQIQYR